MTAHVLPASDLRPNGGHWRRGRGSTNCRECSPARASLPPTQSRTSAGMHGHAVHEERGGKIVIGGYGILKRRGIGPESRQICGNFCAVESRYVTVRISATSG